MGRVSRRKHRSLRKIAARIVQVLAILLCVAAAADFVYNASLATDCFTDNIDQFAQGEKTRVGVDSEDCRVKIMRRDNHLRVDALAALLSVGLAIGATVVLSSAHRRTRRLILTTEAVVLVLTLAYSLLWIYAGR